MKKVVSLLLACATAIGVSVSAFAATDDDGIYGSRALLSDPSVRINYGTSGDNYVGFDAGEIVVAEENGTKAIITPETPLEPGTEYKFQLYYATATRNNVENTDDTDIEPLRETGEHGLNGGKVRLRANKGSSAISSAKIEKRGSGNNTTYRFTVITKENWSTKQTDVEYTISVINQNLNTTGAVEKLPGSVTFVAGYGRFTDEEIDDLSEGDIINISNDKPVILKKQFETLAKNYNYKAIEFEAEDGMWTYEGRVSGMGDTNFTYSRDVIPSIVTKFEDQDFEFLTFGAGVNFPTNGEMRIDASDFSDDYERMYTYLYRDGKLVPVNTTYDTGSDELVFRTNYLGSFVITNEQITDTTIIDTGDNNNTDEDEETPAEELPDEGEGTNPENPNTGATGAVNTAMALAVTSMAAAVAVGRKRK